MTDHNETLKIERDIVSDWVGERLRDIADAGGSPGPFASALLSQAVVLAASIDGKTGVAVYLEDLAAKLRATEGVAGRA